MYFVRASWLDSRDHDTPFNTRVFRKKNGKETVRTIQDIGGLVLVSGD